MAEPGRKRLIFVRHGESEANVRNVISNRDGREPLTSVGRAQVAALADALAVERVARIVSSPIVRAFQTAAILGERFGAPVETSDGLREFDCGIAEGRSDEGAWALHHRVVDAWLDVHRRDERVEGGESYNDMVRRFDPLLEDVIDNAPMDGRSVILVSHGSLLRSMLPRVVVDSGGRQILRPDLGKSEAVITTTNVRAPLVLVHRLVPGLPGGASAHRS